MKNTFLPTRIINYRSVFSAAIDYRWLSAAVNYNWLCCT